MKLILSLSLALVCMLSGTARALQCLRCTNSNDLSCRFPRTVQCSDGEVCFNAFITDQDGIERIYRDCVSSAVCPAVTTGIIETNVGGIYSIANTECCDTDDCNNAGLGFPTPQAVNGRTCPGSVPSDAMFLATVDCRGLEDTCFSGTAFLDNVEFIVGGCGSPNVCDITGELEELPFIDAGFIPSSPTCTAITTTTPEPTTTTTTPEPTTTTTTPEPTTTTTTPEPTTTTTPPEPTTITTTQPTTTTEPTTVYTPSSELLGKIRALVVELKQLSAAIKLELLHQNQLVLLQLHLQLLDYQQQLLDQQEELPFDHHHQLPLYYQQSLLVHHHQLLLHQIQLSLCGQQQLLQLFYRQQLILHQLQELLHGHHHNLLPHYYSYLLQHHHKYHPTTTTEEPTTTTPTPTTTTPTPTTTTPTPTTTTPTPTTTTTSI